MQQETRAVSCGNSPPQEGMVCVGGFRLFNLAGLIWPLSMDRLLSPFLFLFLSLVFFVRSRRCAPGFAALIYAKIGAVYYQSLPSSLRPPKPFLALLDVCMREIGNADKRPCKFNPSVCPPFDSLADKEGTSVSTTCPSVPASPCPTYYQQPVSRRHGFSRDGGEESS